MPRAIRWAFIVFVAAFVVAQVVRPDRSNPLDPPAASLLTAAPANVQAILTRSCADCHSNNTRWPWYTNVSPMSWMIASHVHSARDRFNFSTWTSYDSDDQDKFLGNMCSLTKKGKMPLASYLLIHWDARLSDADVAAICAWSEKLRANLP
ncbi:MAG: heme-binding domain-containing protein [Vicinamibacterales bacterium]